MTMSGHRPALFLLLVLLLALPAVAQDPYRQTNQRDLQALAILRQVVDAAGGPALLGAVQDFTGTGTITFNWAGEAVQGNATVKGRGIRQFRLDAGLPDGVRTWALSNGRASKKEADGTITAASYHDAQGFESLTFPLAHLLVALRDPETSVALVGTETWSGLEVQRLRIRKILSPGDDPSGVRSRLTLKDFLVDSATLRIVAIQDRVNPGSASEDYSHEIRFADYRKVDGVQVPLNISEFVLGQQIFTLQLEELTFNTSVTDSNFEQ